MKSRGRIIAKANIRRRMEAHGLGEAGVIPFKLPVIDGDAPKEFKVGAHGRGVVGRIGNYTDSCYAGELGHVCRAVEKRRREYSSGRHFVRIGLMSLGVEKVAIPTGARRQPVWPKGVIGSIAHSDELALAVVFRSRQGVRGIGVDVEAEGRVSSGLRSLILTDREILHPEMFSRQSIDETLVFSAKESVFKAINPLVGAMIGFREVEIHIDEARSSFAAQFVGPGLSNRLMNEGVGRYTKSQGHIVCMFALGDTKTPND